MICELLNILIVNYSLSLKQRPQLAGQGTFCRDNEEFANSIAGAEAPPR